MAKRIEKSKWSSGVVYELRYSDATGWHTFYVGESYQPDVRRREHKNAADHTSSQLVYQTIAAFNDAGIEWDLFPVAQYGEEGPSDLEDQYVISALQRGCQLTNMKRGNANWLEQQQQLADDMACAGYTCVKSYRLHLEETKPVTRSTMSSVLSELRPTLRARADDDAAKEEKRKKKAAEREAKRLEWVAQRADRQYEHFNSLFDIAKIR